MDTKDPAIEKTEQVIDALKYAHEHNLDIQNKDDVRKMLEVIDPKHSSEDDVEEFMRLLQAANALIGKDTERRSNIN